MYIPRNALPGALAGGMSVSRGLRPLRGLRTPINHGHEPPLSVGAGMRERSLKSLRSLRSLGLLRLLGVIKVVNDFRDIMGRDIEG